MLSLSVILNLPVVILNPSVILNEVKNLASRFSLPRAARAARRGCMGQRGRERALLPLTPPLSRKGRGCQGCPSL